MPRHAAFVFSVFAFAIASIGCEQILGLEDPRLGEGSGATGGELALGGAGGAGAGGGTAMVGGGGGVPTCDGCVGTVLWSHAFGTSGTNAGTAVTLSGSDAVLVTTTNGEVDFGGGATSPNGDGTSIAMARLSSTGEFVWQKRFSGAARETATAVATLPGGDVVIVGDFVDSLEMDGFSASSTALQAASAFAARVNGNDGSAMWLTVFNGVDDETIESVAVSAGGRIAVLGHFETELVDDIGTTASLGGRDVFMAELDASSGSVVSRLAFGSPADESGRRIAFADDGDVVITGDYATTLEVGGISLPNDSLTDVFVAKLSLAGVGRWAKSLGGNNHQHARGLAVAGERFVVGGGFQSEIRYEQASVLADYQAQQFFLFGSVGDGERLSMGGLAEVANADRAATVVSPALDAAGHVVLGGWFRGLSTIGGGSVVSTAGSDDIVVSKLGHDGTVFWSQTFGDGLDDQVTAVAVDAEASLIVGTFAGGLTLDEAHTCVATTCSLIARLAR